MTLAHIVNLRGLLYSDLCETVCVYVWVSECVCVCLSACESGSGGGGGGRGGNLVTGAIFFNARGLKVKYV